jgi:predicted Zn-dependent peptidase
MNLLPRKSALSNGLRIVTVEAPHLHTAVLALYVRCGSRHESPRTNGVSHFLEHMFFRGSRKYPDPAMMNAAVEDAGGNLNGVTTRDYSYYSTPLHPEQLQIGFDVLGDMIAAPLLKDIDVEREIILEEMLDEVDEQGRDIDLDNLSKRGVFQDHPLALKIAGTPENVRRISVADLEAHLARFYGANNLVFTASGPIHHDQVIEMAERAFSRLPSGHRASEEAPQGVADGPRTEFVEHDESQTIFRLNFPCVPEHHPEFPALMVLRRVLDDGLSSRLQVEIVEKRGLAYGVHAGIDTFSDISIFEIEGAAAPNKVASVVVEALRLLSELCETPPTAAEIDRAKRRHRIGLSFTLDSSGDLAGWFGGTEIFRPAETFDERCQQVEAVTPERLVEAARRTFARRNLVAVAVGPKKTGRERIQKALTECSLP